MAAIPSVVEFVNSTEGLRLVDGPKTKIEFVVDLCPLTLRDLLNNLRSNGQDFFFHDPLYPQISDPGAYFSYRPPALSIAPWRMWLGNHGWSGGLYRLDEATILCQMGNLVARKLLSEIEIDHGFWEHLELESDDRNQQMIELLESIHGSGEPPNELQDN